jgi:hypothetical protein
MPLSYSIAVKLAGGWRDGAHHGPFELHEDRGMIATASYGYILKDTANIDWRLRSSNDTLPKQYKV